MAFWDRDYEYDRIYDYNLDGHLDALEWSDKYDDGEKLMSDDMDEDDEEDEDEF